LRDRSFTPQEQLRLDASAGAARHSGPLNNCHAAWDNPMGTDGFEFIEYAAPDPAAMGRAFEAMGFKPVARHRHKNVLLYRQGTINFSSTPNPTALPSALRACTAPASAPLPSACTTPRPPTSAPCRSAPGATPARQGRAN
jgi:hypothetical protein